MNCVLVCSPILDPPWQWLLSMLRVMPRIEPDVICAVFEMHANALDVSFIAHICIYIELLGRSN
jgi:hypothetical protein